jgi:creatinine amidohydrolase/Fe(II)-dependent formamide hydrolase-like protein
MRRLILFLVLSLSLTAGPSAQNPPQTTPAAAAPAGGRQGGRGPAQPPRMPPSEWFSKQTPKNLVEFEMMTWPEVYRAIHEQGKTTALFHTGGTEHRGPQNVNGGHTLMVREMVKQIALRLGNAIAMPVLPYTPNNASVQQTGTIGLTPEILSVVLERLAEQAIGTGFKNIILMGDHGGGQPAAYRDTAKKLEDKYAALAKAENRAQDVHVYFCDEVYAKAQNDFDEYLKSINMPVSSHAGIPDTSSMMYLGKGKDWVRTDLLPHAVEVGLDARNAAAARGGRAAQPPADPSVPRPVGSGVSGDGRKSSAELGKKAIDIKIDYAVRQIQGFIAAQPK